MMHGPTNGKFEHPDSLLWQMYPQKNIILLIKSRRMRKAWHVACMGRGVNKVLVARPEGRRPLGRPRRSWEYNI